MAITLLKKPYTPVVFTSATKTFNVYGKSFYDIRNVYLSGAPYTNTTFYNPFSGVPKLSATYPGFYGVKLLSSVYTSNNDNTVTFTMPSATRAGYVDIILENEAGYGKLTQYVIKDLYSGNQPLTQLRPWALGVKVLSGVELPIYTLYTIDFSDVLVTIADEYIVTI